MNRKYFGWVFVGAIAGFTGSYWLNSLLVEADTVSRSSEIPRTPDGLPNMSGIWQTNNEAHWNLEAHPGRASPIVETGAWLAAAPGLGVVEGGTIPYTDQARAVQQENLAHWLERDPATKCYLPGVPRATYMPHPFQIFQAPDITLISYQYAGADRMVYMDRPDLEAQVDSWMGHNAGSWDGDTLVIDVTGQMADSWFDRSGNHHSGWDMHVQERYTMLDANTISYEATITDPNTFTAPWTIKMPIYRRQEPNLRLVEFICVEHVEEFMYGPLRAPGSLVGDRPEQ